MVAPFNQAWMLLKQRGHELNLPPQSAGIKGMGKPQDFTDRRVDEGTTARRALDEFERLNSMRHPTFSNSREATNELGRRREVTNEMKNQRNFASTAEGNEQFLQDGQRELDQAILARMGQQPEADEMDAMGVPEMDETGMPMSRTLSATPPPNIGQAGSSGEHPFGRNELGPLNNPFTQKPATTQHLENSLQDWAAGAGREAGVPGIVERTRNPFEELSDLYDDNMYNEIHGEPLHENNPAKHSITPTTLRASPRQQKRGQMDSGRAEFKRPDREGPIGMSPSQRAMNLLRRNAAN